MKVINIIFDINQKMCNEKNFPKRNGNKNSIKLEELEPSIKYDNYKTHL